MDKNIHAFYHNSIVGTKIAILNNLFFHHETCYIFSKQKYNNIKKKNYSFVSEPNFSSKAFLITCITSDSEAFFTCKESFSSVFFLHTLHPDYTYVTEL